MTSIALNRPAPEVAAQVVAELLAGRDTALPVDNYRRPALTRQINAQLAQLGSPVDARWWFEDPGVEPAGPDVDAIFGESPSPAAGPSQPLAAVQLPARALPPAPARHLPQHPLGAAVPAPRDPVDLEVDGGLGSDLMAAAYAAFALLQPVMAAGLRRSPLHAGRTEPRAASPGGAGASTASAALAQLSALDF